MKHISFPSIEQYRHTIRMVKVRAKYHGINILPTFKFTGTVKLHGTNAAICSTGELDDDRVWAQSRDTIIDLGNDNMGFATWMRKHEDALRLLLGALKRYPHAQVNPKKKIVTIFGEWCGSGIQKKVAISQLPKMFVIFGAAITDKDAVSDEGGNWLDQVWLTPVELNELHDTWRGAVADGNPLVYCIHKFKTYEITIDFNRPEESQNTLVEITNQVELECPVAKQLGNISGTGEGVVWTCVPGQHAMRTNDLAFKVKGAEHSVTRTKGLAPVDIERIASIREFVTNVLTEARLQQGFDHLRELGLKRTKENTGVFLKWVGNDVLKEERDTMEANGFEKKEVMPVVSREAALWYHDMTS